MFAAKPDGPPLGPWQRGDKSRAEMAAEQGVSQQWLRKLMARERAEAEANGYAREPDDYPYLAITDDPDRERKHWYHPESGRCSLDGGHARKVRIGGGGQGCDGGASRRLPPRRIEGRLQVQDLRDGQHVSPSGPTKYDPPDGLKGGKT